MQNIIAKKKKKTHPTAFNSDALRTNYDNDGSLLQRHFCCNKTSFCCINNVQSNAMLLSLQILPCIQFMSFYAPNINRKKIV